MTENVAASSAANQPSTTKAPPPQHVVFVYGTLKRGGRFGHVLAHRDVNYLGEATTPGTLYNLGWYPGLRINPIKPCDVVHGEVYEVSDAVLKHLDIIEGVEHGLFRRTTIAVKMNPGGKLAGVIMLASVYEFAGLGKDAEALQPIEGGKWPLPAPPAPTEKIAEKQVVKPVEPRMQQKEDF